MDADREFTGDEAEADEAQVVHAGSTSTRAERTARSKDLHRRQIDDDPRAQTGGLRSGSA